jgi:hypothetical protein
MLNAWRLHGLGLNIIIAAGPKKNQRPDTGLENRWILELPQGIDPKGFASPPWP